MTRGSGMVTNKPIFCAREVEEISALLTMENLPIHMVAVLLNVSRLTLARWRCNREGPPFRLVKGGAIVYPRSSFESFLRAARQSEGKTPETKPSKRVRRILSYRGLHEGRKLHG